MNKEAQRIAIAEACGFINVKPWIVKNVRFYGDDITCGIWSDKGWVPDYLNDLNAMHEAEKVLTGFQWYDWCQCIHGLTSESKKDLWDTASIIEIQQATAAQRAEAFLRTLGKWQTTDGTNCEEVATTPQSSSSAAREPATPQKETL